MDKPKPDFLCAGTPKCGTSWLHRNLRHHSQIWLPPVKEIHYLDGLSHPQGRHLQTWRIWPHQLRTSLRERDRFAAGRQRAWFMRYFFQPRNDRWYASLFPQEPGLVCGEIAPSCCRVGPDSIERIRRLNPDMKIVFLLRDPVERAWSHAMMYFRNRTGKAHITVADIDADELKLLFDKHRLSVGNYARNLRRWQAVFTQERLFVSDLETIGRDPAAVLRRLYRFLGVTDESAKQQELLHEPVLAGSHEPIPPASRHYLTELYRGMIAELREVLDPAEAGGWLSAREGRGF